MTFQEWAHVEQWVVATMEQPLGNQAQFIETVCPAPFRPVVQRMVEKLHSDALSEQAVLVGDWHKEALREPVELTLPAEHHVGKTIGAYQVVRQIGQGGMGRVYMAERDGWADPVALKILRYDRMSDEMLLRFRWERIILAGLDHPYIVRLLDSGTTADGRPYSVMPYIVGTPLVSYCREKNLALTERLTLFRHVCGAIQHAHERLILHCDLKPAHVVVVEHQGAPTVCVLDFGIAAINWHAVQGEEARTSMPGLPSREALPCTPHYAAPEQQAGQAITPATDVYALGRVLQELMQGVDELAGAAAARSPLTAIAEQATAQHAEKRFPTVDALAKAVQACQSRLAS